METLVNKLRNYMPAVSEQLYLDNAGVAPLPTTVRDAITQHLDQRCLRGKAGIKATAAQVLGDARKYAAQLVGCEDAEIALVHNTAEGINIVAQGFPWKPGDNMILLDNEFPSNVYPWLGLQHRGVEIRTVSTRAGAIEAADLQDHIDARTRMVALSHVGFVSGFRVDLEAIGDLCKRRKVWFVVDAAQSLGALRIDAAKANIAALACSGWKWLLGPIGIGLLYCSNALIEELSPVFVGPSSMAQEEWDPPCYPFNFRRGACRFEYSSLDLSNICGFAKAMESLHEAGIDRIEARVLELAGLLQEELGRRGFELSCPAASELEHRSGIVSVRKQGTDPVALHTRLRDRGVACALWHGHVRFSPHFYNTAQEVERLLDIINS